jgi:hypothetical protein
MRPIHSAVNPLSVPKKEKKDHSSSSEEKNKSLASIVPGKVRLELVEVCYAETLENQSREPEGFLGARPSIPFSPRREKYLSEEGTLPSYRKTGQGASRIEVLQSRIPGKGLPPPIPLLSLSSDSGVNNVEFPKTAPPPTEDVSSKNPGITSPRSKFTIPTKTSSEKRPTPLKTTVRKSMHPIVQQSEGGHIVSPRPLGVDILPATSNYVVISFEPSGTLKPGIELTLTNPQNQMQSPRRLPDESDLGLERSEEYIGDDISSNTLSTINELSPESHSNLLPENPLHTQKPTAKFAREKLTRGSRLSNINPTSSGALANSVRFLIAQNLGTQTSTEQALIILYCAAGGKIHANPEQPEIMVYAKKLYTISNEDRWSYLNDLLDALPEYLSKDEIKIIRYRLGDLYSVTNVSRNLKSIAEELDALRTNLKEELSNLGVDIKSKIRE